VLQDVPLYIVALRIIDRESASGVIRDILLGDGGQPSPIPCCGPKLNRQQRRRLGREGRGALDAVPWQDLYAIAVEQHARGLLPEAIATYERVLAAQPGHSEATARLAYASYNLANAQARVGSFVSAIYGYRRAAALLPGFAQAHGNLIRALLAAGDPRAALDAATKALELAATGEIKRLAVRSAGLVGGTHAPDVRNALVLAFQEGWSRMADVAYAAAPALVADLDVDPGPDSMVANALLLAYLVSAPVADERLERHLTKTRSDLLFARRDRDLALTAAIARQCFINEYVWSILPAEAVEVARLKASLDSGKQPTSVDLSTLAMFQPLSSVIGAERFESLSSPDCICDLLRQQLVEPRQEASLVDDVVQLTPISHPTSVAVERQYEQNPYPRWVVCDRPDPTTLEVFLRRSLPAGSLTGSIPERPNVLVAGCGTGQHPITLARRFPDANVTAVDLSRSSLAYAARKSRELGVSVRYFQADILALGEWPERFDVVDASGVLHHLSDPLAGWRILVGLLKPAGLMRLGLYSRLGRIHVAAARQLVDPAGVPPDAPRIMASRAMLMQLPSDELARRVVTSFDFYSTSSCRDLLFHVQEQSFDLPTLARLLKELNLSFLGFDLPDNTLSQFRHCHGKLELDLDVWHAFETDNPNTFTAMYQFWAASSS